METQGNIEPNGWNENQQRNETGASSESQFNKVDVDDTNSGMAANADGNVTDENVQNPNPEDINDGKGFLGDFATVQHDDALEDKIEDDLGSEDEGHIIT
ncbi:MAG: hypothetical protein EOP00_03785 [Pedobacter sp.]|nr:MAG: hypothetical protein EOP00_03785 [Pedobacter sp.]